MVNSEVIGAAIFINGVRIQKHRMAKGKAHQYSTKNSVVAKATKAITAMDCVKVIPNLKPSISFTLGTRRAIVATNKLAPPPIKAKSEESTSKL